MNRGTRDGGEGRETQGKERIRVFKLSGRSVRKVRGAGERRRKGRRIDVEAWRKRGRRRLGDGGPRETGGAQRAKPRCRRFGFGKSAFVGNRARSAREGRDQWP